LLSTVSGLEGKLARMYICCNGQVLLTVPHNGDLQLFGLPDGSPIATLTPGRNYRPALNGDRRVLATAVFDVPAIRIWDLNTGKLRTVLEADYSGLIEDMAFTPDGRQLAVCYGDATADLWTLGRRSKRRLGKLHSSKRVDFIGKSLLAVSHTHAYGDEETWVFTLPGGIQRGRWRRGWRDFVMRRDRRYAVFARRSSDDGRPTVWDLRPWILPTLSLSEQTAEDLEWLETRLHGAQSRECQPGMALAAGLLRAAMQSRRRGA
jgi:WD40 repeat protein